MKEKEDGKKADEQPSKQAVSRLAVCEVDWLIDVFGDGQTAELQKRFERGGGGGFWGGSRRQMMVGILTREETERGTAVVQLLMVRPRERNTPRMRASQASM